MRTKNGKALEGGAFEGMTIAAINERLKMAFVAMEQDPALSRSSIMLAIAGLAHMEGDPAAMQYLC